MDLAEKQQRLRAIKSEIDDLSHRMQRLRVEASELEADLYWDRVGLTHEDWAETQRTPKCPPPPPAPRVYQPWEPDHPALQVACPRCFAGRREVCRTTAGRPADDIHLIRRHEANRVAAELQRLRSRKSS